jgi:hypothetical protein
VSLLGEVDLSVPLSPGLERGKHATLAAHVTESTLAGSGGAGAANTWDTGDGATSAPGFSGVLVALEPENSVCLSSVLGHVGVHELDGVVSDGGSEDCGHVDAANNFGFLRVNTN